MGDFDGCINELETEENSTQIECLPPFPPCHVRKDTTKIKFMALVVVSKYPTTLEARIITSEPIRVTKLENEVSPNIRNGTMSPSLRRRKREGVTMQDEDSTSLENDDPKSSVSVSPNDATVKDKGIAENVTHEDNNGDTDDGRETTWDGDVPKNTKIPEPAMQIDLVAYLEWPDNNFSRF